MGLIFSAGTSNLCHAKLKNKYETETTNQHEHVKNSSDLHGMQAMLFVGREGCLGKKYQLSAAFTIPK